MESLPWSSTLGLSKDDEYFEAAEKEDFLPGNTNFPAYLMDPPRIGLWVSLRQLLLLLLPFWQSPSNLLISLQLNCLRRNKAPWELTFSLLIFLSRRSFSLSFPRWSARVSNLSLLVFEGAEVVVAEGHNSPCWGPGFLQPWRAHLESGEWATSVFLIGDEAWFGNGIPLSCWGVEPGEDRNLELTSRDFGTLRGLWAVSFQFFFIIGCYKQCDRSKRKEEGSEGERYGVCWDWKCLKVETNIWKWRQNRY